MSILTYSPRSFLQLAAMFTLIALATASCDAQTEKKTGKMTTNRNTTDATTPPKSEKLELATFGAGCFWCTEAVFERVKGVEEVASGYAGGFVPNPTYRAVCTGRTGHAEVIQLKFDPNVISYADLLQIFWKTHDPTTLNQQGPDFGTQYRSVVFYHNDQQKETATAYKKQLGEERAFRKPIVTEISPITKFYPAEAYHQDYYELNKRARYCTAYISPKIKKFNRMFKDKLKEQK